MSTNDLEARLAALESNITIIADALGMPDKLRQRPNGRARSTMQRPPAPPRPSKSLAKVTPTSVGHIQQMLDEEDRAITRAQFERLQDAIWRDDPGIPISELGSMQARMAFARGYAAGALPPKHLAWFDFNHFAGWYTHSPECRRGSWLAPLRGALKHYVRFYQPPTDALDRRS
jgi:hypothetical protein